MEGKGAEATTRFRDALRQLADLGVWFDRSQAASQAVVLVGIDDAEIAAAARDAAVLFERLGARPELDRLESAMQRSRKVPEPVSVS
jgi:hypothetical protein